MPELDPYTSPRQSAAAPAVAAGRDLLFAGIARQAELTARRELSPRDLVEACLDRIERLDPELNAFRVVLAERALADADLAGERLAGGDTAPLLGVPIAVKDDVDVAGEATALGTGATAGVAAADAEVVRRLRAAGAIVIGKTHLPELLMWPFTESASWGATRNPWDASRTPGGSSGGSAVAVAAGMVGAALGSDGGGSIRIPAACCGIVGIKPQRDRVSLAPKREHWHGLSAFGPLARSVRDAALFLDVIARDSPLDVFSAAARRPPGRLCVAVSFRFPPGVGALVARLAPEARGAVEEVADLLRRLGHEVVSRDPAYGTVAADVVVRYLAGVHEDARSLAHPDRLEPRTRRLARLGGAVSPGAIRRSRAREARHTERMGSLFAECDVLITPALAAPPPGIAASRGRGALLTAVRSAPLAQYTTPWNVTGQPAAVVPVGIGEDGLPLAVQLVGRPHGEATLISLAAQLEAERPWCDQRPPIS